MTRPYEYITAFPDWYDDRGQWCFDPQGNIIIAHPEHKPMIYDMQLKCWREISPIIPKAPPA